MPELTGLQFLVVSLLFGGAMTSSELRDELMRRGYTGSRVAFSRLMGRLIRGAIVSYVLCADGSRGEGGVRRQNSYQTSDLGLILWKRAHDFYLSFEPPPEDLDTVEVSVAEFAEYGPRERKELADKQFAEEFMGMFERGWGKNKP